MGMKAVNGVRNLVGMDRDEAARLLRLSLPKILPDVKIYPKSFPENLNTDLIKDKT
jgi:hypothetical protein